MTINAIQANRYSDLIGSNDSAQQINSLEQQLQTVQNEITTGNAINQPSDNPGASAVILQLQKSLDQQNQYLSNVQTSQSQLSEADSSLSSLSSLITQATTLASQDVGSGTTSAERTADAQVVQTLYNQAVSIGNTQFEGQYIFGGDKSNQAPFVPAAGGVQFVGSTTVLQNATSNGMSVPYQVSAQSVFGATSSQVTGSVDLTPALTPDTRISDLRGATGAGVTLGTIQLGNGSTTAQVDLSGADTIQDVVNDINNAAVGGITASISGNHLVLSGGATDDITVTDPTGGTAAKDLGILQTTGAGPGVSVVGASAQPNVTDLTPLSALNGGAGIDATHGLIITNGAATATVNLSSATTVQDMINAIDASGTNVTAQINAAGTGIDIINTVQGTQMTIGENGGTTAADLGVRSYSPSTPLTDLNGGAGVTTATSGADFQITASDGTSFSVTLAGGATTVQDVLNDINTASDGSVTASFATTGNGIVLTDNTTGAGTLTLTPLNQSAAAGDLGLSAPAVGNVITGSDVNPVEAQGLFSDLAALQTALQNNDVDGITKAGAALQNDYQQVSTAQGVAEAQAQELQGLQTSLTTQNTSTQAMIGQLQGADMTTTITQFTTLQTALTAALEVASKTLNLSLVDFLT